MKISHLLWLLTGFTSVVLPGLVHAQDISVGRAAYAQCAACHSVNGSNGLGPTLKGVVGREAGQLPGFRFSRAMKNAGITWDSRVLDAYLAAPQKVVPGNLMPFSGINDEQQRADIIAYLVTLK